MKVARVREMQEMDMCAIESLSIPEEILMENAGQAAAAILDRELGIRGKRYIVVCGIGNNGGDGLVVARKIHSNGGMAHVYIVGDAGRFKCPSQINLKILKKMSVDVTALNDPDDIRKALSSCDGVVDGLFGTGLDREIRGIHREVILQINRAGKRVLSLDIPSGIHGDTGEILGVAVKADYTIAFGLPKAGNLLFPGYAFCGKLHVSHISFPPSLYEQNDLKIETNLDVPLPSRDPEAHKGSVGDCLFIAGAAGYFGAPFFSAMSFLKAGGGYARLASPASVAGLLAAKGPEIVFLPQKETEEGSVSLLNKEALLTLSAKTDMAVVGPGLSLQTETQQLVCELTREMRIPLIIDGDGITAVAGKPELLRARTSPTVLTPHLGEMSRLSGKSVGEIRAERIPILQETSKRLQSAIVLKGPHTLIGFPDGRIFVNLNGNAGMATAGSGDVLTGTMAAMMGLGLSFEEAVRKGVFIHGLSGDLAARNKGEDGMTAQDVLDNLPQALSLSRKSQAGGFPQDGFIICP